MNGNDAGRPGALSMPDPAVATTPAGMVSCLEALKEWSGGSYQRLSRKTIPPGKDTPILSTGLIHDRLRSTRPLEGDPGDKRHTGRRRSAEEFIRHFVIACLRERGAPANMCEETAEHWVARWRAISGGGTSGLPEDVRRAGRPVHRPRLVPAQLPVDVAEFAARRQELEFLDRLLPDPASPKPFVCTVTGTAGVGKTSLAVRWAHRVRHRFPDGQLYIDLRGFGPGDPLDPADAVRRFLDAFGVPAEQLPADPEARTDLFRSIVADLSVLCVLDNARDANQVLPLLPGSRACGVLVTSRNRLPGLVAAVNARPLDLDPLTVEESREMLAYRLGTEALETEPDQRDRIIESCAGLPVALAIVAARIATGPAQGLHKFADDMERPLDVLDAGDDSVNARRIFSWSYRQLGAESARLFRLLGVHPGPDVTVAVAASLSGRTEVRARAMVEELSRACLIREQVPGRYAAHDLLRVYAAELVENLDSEAERRAATTRLLDHYLHTAFAAARSIDPHRDPIDLPPRSAGVTPEPIGGTGAALEWFATEHSVVLALLETADAGGFDTHVWQLAWTLPDYLERRGHWDAWATAQRAALNAARRSGDRAEEARAHRNLARPYIRLERLDDAHSHLREALELYDELDDATGRAHTHHTIAGTYERQQRCTDALDHAQQALELFRSTGHRAGQARTLNAVGWYLALQGEHARALGFCEQALELFRHLEYLSGEGATWDALGHVHHDLGHHRQAIECFRRALELFRRISGRYLEAETLRNLGDVEYAAGDLDAARREWRQACEILDELGHPSADVLLDRLAGLDDENQ